MEIGMSRGIDNVRELRRVIVFLLNSSSCARVIPGDLDL